MKYLETLKSVCNALNDVDVRGKHNHLLIVACLNDIEKIIKEAEESGNGNNESASN